jgi:hypothetical protein
MLHGGRGHITPPSTKADVTIHRDTDGWMFTKPDGQTLSTVGE